MNTKHTPGPWMVQVWEYGRWCDYWPVERRKNARACLSPYWRTKKWRAIPMDAGLNAIRKATGGNG
jgi:hypothetical protein